MAEYLTKEEVVQELFKVSHRLSDPPIDKAELETIKELHSIMHKIEQMPAADVVEVVRCKDCEYFSTMPRKNNAGTFTFCHKIICGVKADDFCSYGERRADD